MMGSKDEEAPANVMVACEAPFVPSTSALTVQGVSGGWAGGVKVVVGPDDCESCPHVAVHTMGASGMARPAESFTTAVSVCGPDPEMVDGVTVTTNGPAGATWSVTDPVVFSLVAITVHVVEAASSDTASETVAPVGGRTMPQGADQAMDRPVRLCAAASVAAAVSVTELPGSGDVVLAVTTMDRGGP
jgi:hypothetical protein